MKNWFFKFISKNKTAQKCTIVTEEFKTVCFFSNTAIGDTIFNTPVFRVFRQNFPHVKTIALLNPTNATLFKNDPNLDEIVVYDGKNRGFFKTLKRLKTKNIDIIFLLHSNEPQASPLAALCGARFIFKLPNFTNEFNFLHSNPPKKFGAFRYVVLNRLEQLEFVGIKSSDTRLRLYLENSDYSEVKSLLQKDSKSKFIGFNMGASTLSRQWFLKRWHELGKLVLSDKSTTIVLTGSPSEKNMCNELEKALGNKRVLNLAGKFNLRQACALIDCLDILITPDTGPLHIASALQTPTVALFVVADSVLSNPDFDTAIHKFIQKRPTCTPCIKKRCKYQECMLAITAGEVYEQILEILKNRSQS